MSAQIYFLLVMRHSVRCFLQAESPWDPAPAEDLPWGWTLRWVAPWTSGGHTELLQLAPVRSCSTKCWHCDVALEHARLPFSWKLLSPFCPAWSARITNCSSCERLDGVGMSSIYGQSKALVIRACPYSLWFSGWLCPGSLKTKLDAKGIALRSLGLTPWAGWDAAPYNKQENEQNQINFLHKRGKKIAVEPLEPLSEHWVLSCGMKVWGGGSNSAATSLTSVCKVEGKGHLVQNFALGWGYFVGLIPAFPGH